LRMMLVLLRRAPGGHGEAQGRAHGQGTRDPVGTVHDHLLRRRSLCRVAGSGDDNAPSASYRWRLRNFIETEGNDGWLTPVRSTPSGPFTGWKRLLAVNEGIRRRRNALGDHLCIFT
jgi:hypothetical protein